MKFEYNSHESNMYVTKKMILTNNGNATAHFKFKNRNKKPVFLSEPREGHVNPGKDLEIIWYYYPRGKKSANDHERVELCIDNGKKHLINLHGKTPMVSVKAVEPLNFGVIPVSQKVEKILKLKNSSK